MDEDGGTILVDGTGLVVSLEGNRSGEEADLGSGVDEISLIVVEVLDLTEMSELEW